MWPACLSQQARSWGTATGTPAASRRSASPRTKAIRSAGGWRRRARRAAAALLPLVPLVPLVPLGWRRAPASPLPWGRGPGPALGFRWALPPAQGPGSQGAPAQEALLPWEALLAQEALL